MACHQKRKKKTLQTHFVPSPKQPFSFSKSVLKNAKQQVHKGYPLAAPCICNYELELAFVIRNNLSGFSFLPFLKLWLIGSQSESNGDTIRAYQKREDLPEPYQKPWGESKCLVYNCKSDKKI